MVENVGLKYPTSMQIEVTENCNHNCFYCYNHWRDDNATDNMTREDAEILSDKIINDIKPFHIVLTGGEPLINFDITLYLMKRFEEAKIFNNLNSNLILLTKERLDKILDLKPNLQILTSIPNHKKELYKQVTGKNNLSIFYENLENALRKGVHIVPNMVFHKLNKEYIYETGKYLHENYGIKNFAATPLINPSKREVPYILSKEEMTKPLEDLIKLRDDFGIKISSLEVIPLCALPKHLREESILNKKCSAGSTSFTISPKGDVRACGHSPIKEGNLKSQSFKEIWKTLKPYRKNHYIPKECLENCVEVEFCHGGCRFESYQEGENLNKKDSRMSYPLKQQIKRNGMQSIELNKKYFISDFVWREESEKQYVLFNGEILYANKGLRDFLINLQKQGNFNLSEFPENMQTKAKNLGKVLLSKKFLIHKK
jgi:radical SAM protein with 4Fe4S-binding SPASM domain|tara:strand:+ start:4951 stop:6237 length:1287 start_codon:yes stop_codon:yes gene_type:complete